ncbi:hypothetical protein L596_009853 [Steinernema carpocapsae]|nr:hypothetical protein L596_009853 [Steinernema carpocapsae]
MLTVAVFEEKSTKKGFCLVGMYLVYQILMFLIGVSGMIYLITQYPNYIYGAGFGAVMTFLFLPPLIIFFFQYFRFMRARNHPPRFCHRQYPNVFYTEDEMPDYISHAGQSVHGKRSVVSMDGRFKSVLRPSI